MPPLNSPLFVFIYFLHIVIVYVLLFPFCPLAIIEKNTLNKQSWHEFSKRKATADKALRQDQFCQTFSDTQNAPWPVHDVTMDDVRADMCRACDWTFPKLSQYTFILGNIHGYVKQKKPPMIFLKRGKSLGLFDNEGKRANQVSSFDTDMTPQKIAF